MAMKSKYQKMTIELKLVVDKQRNKVIFAEAQKDFVDLLVYILSLPLSAVVKYLEPKGPTSLGKLHNSLLSIMKAGYINPPPKDNSIEPKLSTYVPVLRQLSSSPKWVRNPVLNMEQASYVKPMVPYMVADDLSVSPLDYHSVSVVLKGYGEVVEKVVEFGTSQVLDLLQATLYSETPLTSVFLKAN
ncbi:unnamed protein product [Linum trigynum]|uniref:Uncharacterized protein n=1 Tax=Linum trigynum TaxID=586398 RepID=A0AAV2E3P2_9ROSI